MSKKGAKNSKFRRNNPKRGGPGILVLTETGRESKGRREALEILRYYFYGNDNVQNNANGHTASSTCDDDEHEERSLTMEEEIALLKKGISADAVLQNPKKDNDGSGKGTNNTPFGIYETGCKGTVSIMNTQPKCELISVPIIERKQTSDDNNDGDGKDEKEKGGEACKDTHENGKSTSNDSKRKIADVEADKTDSGETSISTPVQKKIKSDDKKSNNDDSTSNTDEKSNDHTKPKWDPIKTVQKIIHDIRVQNKKAPRSRFVTRMVPVQVTCFASMDEIEANARELIKQYLLPFGINHDGDTLPSFKIEFKKRNCSHIQRQAVVDCVAQIVQELSTEFLNENHDKDDCASKALFRVDLKNPEYSIVIELCRTLCGMSVVPDPLSYRNFNLIKVQEESQVAE